MQRLRPLVLVSLTAVVLGCGQKGPLVLPDAQHPHKKLTLPAPSKPPAAPTSAPSPPPASPPPASPAVPTSPDGSPTPAPAPQH